MASTPDDLTVGFEDDQRRLMPGQTLTLGRQADLSVDRANRRLHRVLARLAWYDGWWLENVGRSIALVATDLDGSSYARVAPGEALPLPFANTALTFSAGQANYRLTLHTRAPVRPVGATNAPGDLTLDRTESPESLEFNAEQLQLLAVLARPRLDGPVTIADFPSSRQMARELEWSLSKFNRKLDHLCVKLDRVGVPGVIGSRGGPSASERRLIIANFAVESGLIRR